jgi:hypothetical protein
MVATARPALKTGVEARPVEEVAEALFADDVGVDVGARVRSPMAMAKSNGPRDAQQKTKD